jgi:hypothetical protein
MQKQAIGSLSTEKAHWLDVHKFLIGWSLSNTGQHSFFSLLNRATTTPTPTNHQWKQTNKEPSLQAAY